MSYICPYCKKNVFMNIGIHFMEHPCLEYLSNLEQQKTKKPCPECDGKGEYLCTGMSYQGYGKTVKCPTCQGTGEIDD